ncbi:MAG: nuclear transport factor 2 family protein [Acidimicrobiia bacterium]
MTDESVQRWLDSYISAWKTSDPEAIGELFTDDAVYSYRPWISDRHTVTGRDAIVASWLKSPDDPAIWEAQYESYAVEGDKAVAVGWTRYSAEGEQPEKLYHNAYLLRFDDDGLCAELREFYFLEN